jgi:voltage-gated potassium channel
MKTSAGQTRGQALLERRARKIASGRFIVLSISATLLVVAVAGAIVMRLADPSNFPSFGLAVWWAVQTFTTVGYGDIVPTTGLGKFVGSIVMVVGLMFLSFLTAAVTSALIQRAQNAREEARGAAATADLTEVVAGIARLEERLKRLEMRLGAAD